VSTLKEALESASKAAYGEGWEDLGPFEQAVVRETMLPIVNAILPHVREGIAQQLDYRAEMALKDKSVNACKQLTYAAAKARTWPA
jgi:hypothetical protein